MSQPNSANKFAACILMHCPELLLSATKPGEDLRIRIEQFLQSGNAAHLKIATTSLYWRCLCTSDLDGTIDTIIEFLLRYIRSEIPFSYNDDTRQFNSYAEFANACHLALVTHCRNNVESQRSSLALYEKAITKLWGTQEYSEVTILLDALGSVPDGFVGSWWKRNSAAVSSFTRDGLVELSEPNWSQLCGEIESIAMYVEIQDVAIEATAVGGEIPLPEEWCLDSGADQFFRDWPSPHTFVRALYRALLSESTDTAEQFLQSLEAVVNEFAPRVLFYRCGRLTSVTAWVSDMPLVPVRASERDELAREHAVRRSHLDKIRESGSPEEILSATEDIVDELRLSVRTESVDRVPSDISSILEQVKLSPDVTDSLVALEKALFCFDLPDKIDETIEALNDSLKKNLCAAVEPMDPRLQEGFAEVGDRSWQQGVEWPLYVARWYPEKFKKLLSEVSAWNSEGKIQDWREYECFLDIFLTAACALPPEQLRKLLPEIVPCCLPYKDYVSPFPKGVDDPFRYFFSLSDDELLKWLEERPTFSEGSKGIREIRDELRTSR